MDLKVMRIIRNIAATETQFTFTKSISVTSCKSFVNGASPITIESLLYFLTILFISAICEFTSSVAALQSEQTKAISQLSLFSLDSSFFGIILLGMLTPLKESIPSAHLTPFTSSIFFNISLFSLDAIPFFINTIWVLFILNFSSSFLFATAESSDCGSAPAISQ